MVSCVSLFFYRDDESAIDDGMKGKKISKVTKIDAEQEKNATQK